MTTDPVLDTFSGLLFLATLTLAWYTARLHAATVSLAKDTVEATKVSDRHHQESLSPVCVIRDVQCNKTGAMGAAMGAATKFKIQNVGFGPAISVRATVTPVGPGLTTSGIVCAFTCDALKAGEMSPDMGPQTIATTSAAVIMFVVRVEYQSIFNSWGVSEWNVNEGGSYGVLRMELPAPQQRILEET